MAAETLHQPLKAWLEGEMNAGLGRKIGASSVVTCRGSNLEAAQKALESALDRLTRQAPEQLSLKVQGLV